MATRPIRFTARYVYQSAHASPRYHPLDISHFGLSFSREQASFAWLCDGDAPPAGARGFGRANGKQKAEEMDLGVRHWECNRRLGELKALRAAVRKALGGKEYATYFRNAPFAIGSTGATEALDEDEEIDGEDSGGGGGEMNGGSDAASQAAEGAAKAKKAHAARPARARIGPGMLVGRMLPRVASFAAPGTTRRLDRWCRALAKAVGALEGTPTGQALKVGRQSSSG